MFFQFLAQSNTLDYNNDKPPAERPRYSGGDCNGVDKKSKSSEGCPEEMSSGSSNSPYFDRNAQFYLKMFNANTAKVIRLFFWTFGKKNSMPKNSRVKK